jgi:hypothetical protein
MNQSPGAQEEKVRLVVSETITVHEMAERVRAAIVSMRGEALFASELALFERMVGGKLERALDVLMNSAANTAQFQYALCWLDASVPSPVLQLCWSSTRFRELLRRKSDGCLHPREVTG